MLHRSEDCEETLRARGDGERLHRLPDDRVGEVSQAGEEAPQADLPAPPLLSHTCRPEQ